MINKIKNILFRIFYSLPFGIKGASDEMFTSKSSSNSEGSSIHKIVEKDSLGGDLIKGEVTKQVEELRYRTYKVDNESKKYEYIGNGVALKKEENKKEKIEFTQENKLLCADILTELERVDKEYGKDEYTLSILYDDITRFKLEKYCTSFYVIEKEDNFEITFYFSKYPDKYEKTTYFFISELKKIINGEKKEFNHLNTIQFITYKALGEDDMIQYKFNDLTLLKAKDNEMSFSLIYKTNKIERNNLINKFYSKSMDEKYKNKEKKNIDLDLTNSERVMFCSQCGKRIPTYDGDITKETYGYPLCKECAEKILDIYN